MNRRDTFLAVLVAALWGFNFLVIDWGMGAVPPLLFAAIRFTVVAVPACLWVPRPKVPFRVVATVGALMSLGQFAFLYLGLHLGMPPGLAALVLQSQVVFTIAIAALVLRERPSRGQVAGVAIGAAGLALVAVGVLSGAGAARVPAAALVLALLAGLSWAAGNVSSRASRAPGGLALTVWSATVVPVPLAALSLLVDGPAAVARGLASFGWDAAGSTAYTAGLSSLVGYAIWNSLLSRYPSGRVVPWVLLVPVVAMSSSWALNGEVPSPAELAGAAVLVAGVLIAQGIVRLPGARRTRPADAAAGNALAESAAGSARGPAGGAIQVLMPGQTLPGSTGQDPGTGMTRQAIQVADYWPDSARE